MTFKKKLQLFLKSNQTKQQSKLKKKENGNPSIKGKLIKFNTK